MVAEWSGPAVDNSLFYGRVGTLIVILEKIELKAAKAYDYILLNRDLRETVENLNAIFTAESCKAADFPDDFWK